MLVNTTPLGTTPAVEESPLPNGPFTGDIVYDVVYNPAETRLLREARAAGCTTIGGLEMLIAQAERQFEWWTGAPPAPGVMLSAAQSALAASSAATSSMSSPPDTPSTLGTLGTFA